MGLAGYGAGKAGEAAEAYGMSDSQVMIIGTLSCVGIFGTLSRIRPVAEALGRRRNGLERRGTSAESTEVMRLPGEGVAEYGSFWKPGRLDEIIKEDLLGIGRAYEYQAMARIRREAYAADRIEIREVAELLVSPEELASWERYQDFLRNGSRMEPTREELIGQQRLMEYEALSRVDYEEVLELRRGSEGGTITDLRIMSRNSGRGNPSTITHFDVDLNTRQKYLLQQLPNCDSSIIINKGDVNLKDLAALTAKTGDEFAMFIRGSQRMIIRGSENAVKIDGAMAQKLYSEGFKWSGHTHLGTGINVKFASEGDMYILEQFNQTQSIIFDSQGNFNMFESGE